VEIITTGSSTYDSIWVSSLDRPALEIWRTFISLYNEKITQNDTKLPKCHSLLENQAHKIKCHRNFDQKLIMQPKNHPICCHIARIDATE